MFLNDNQFYEEYHIEKPLPILNECIHKRYRNKGYQVVFALYPDKNIFGVIPLEHDKIIYTDITFEEASAYDSKGNKKKNFTPKYPSELLLVKQLGAIDKLVVGGYHATDCVKRVAEMAINLGINTLVDLDLTDFFFNLYKQKEYFKIAEYDPLHYKNHILKQHQEYGEEFAEKLFNNLYSSPVYGYSNNKIIISNRKY